MATTTNNGWTTPDDTNLVKNGAADMRTLGQAIDTSVGKSLLAWQVYTPTLTGWGVGNGTWDARYLLSGKTCTLYIGFTVGSTTTRGATFTVSLPAGATAKTASGFGFGAVSSSPNAVCMGSLATTTTVQALVFDASGAYARGAHITTGVPGTWTAGDLVKFNLTYEVA